MATSTKKPGKSNVENNTSDKNMDEESDDSSSSDESNEGEENDDTTSDDERNESDDAASDESTSSDEKPLSIMSIYKIMNSRLGLVGKTIGTAIIESLTNTGLEHQKLDKKEIGCFSLHWFCHCTKIKCNRNSSIISKYLKGQSNIPGDRKSGNVLAFYRRKEKKPEIFLVCDGSSSQFILHLADPEFRLNMAKKYIDEDNVLKIEKYCLAGAALSQQSVFKKKESIHSILMEQYIAGITSVIKANTRLNEILVEKTDNKSKVGIEIGLNYVRIKIGMRPSILCDVLNTISCELEKPSNFEGPLIQALEYVQRMKDETIMAKLNEKICKRLFQAIKGNAITDDLYLSHWFVNDFQTSSSFTLKVKRTTLLERRSVPTMDEVFTSIRQHYLKRQQSIELENLKKGDIKLYFTTPEKSKGDPIQKYIQGCIKEGETMYYRLANKWFKCAGSFFFTIDRNFRELAENCLLKGGEKDCVDEILKYPWKYDSGIDLEKHCSILKMSHKHMRKLMEILCKQTVCILNGATLCEGSFLIPDDAELCKKVETRERKERKERKQRHKKEQPSAGTSKTETSVQNKQKSTREILWAYRSDPSKASKEMKEVLNEPLEVCCNGKDTFKVKNPVLTEDMWTEISNKFPDLKQNDVLSFLKSTMALSEGDFNELFLLCEHSGYIVFPGDRILSNKIELFDILIHHQKTNKTFLIHNKEELNGTARISCAQIRNSAEMLWHDFVRGHTQHLELWWDQATNPSSDDVYRKMLQTKLKRIKKEEFLKMFSTETTVVFVLAFRSRPKKPRLSSDLRPIIAEDFKDLEQDDNKILEVLVQEKFVTQAGYLSDKMIKLTSAKKFITECAGNEALKKYSENVREKIYSKLKKIGMYNLSTIAKLELLTLDSTFSRFQIGGRRHFELRLLQHESS